MRAAVFLDRDGVLNRAMVRDGKPHPPQSLEELQVLDGVPEALMQLKTLGYFLAVVTNQPDVARGTTPKEMVEEINHTLAQQLPINAWYTCFHDDKDQCVCRKPQPGALQQAAQEHHLDLTQSVMVGDRWKDIAAGQAAGCQTAWIDAGYQEPSPNNPDHRVTSLREAVAWITQNHGAAHENT